MYYKLLTIYSKKIYIPLKTAISDPKICRKSQSMEEIGSHAMAPSQSWRSPLGERKNKKDKKHAFKFLRKGNLRKKDGYFLGPSK